MIEHLIIIESVKNRNNIITLSSKFLYQIIIHDVFLIFLLQIQHFQKSLSLNNYHLSFCKEHIIIVLLIWFFKHFNELFLEKSMFLVHLCQEWFKQL